MAIASKLILGIVAFVLIGWVGARDKRIGGVLLTFPLLNGIAMLAGVDPVGIARTIYLVVAWNCALFLFVVHRYAALPPLPDALNDQAKIIVRVIVWVGAWVVGAALLASLRDVLSSAIWLFVGALALAGWSVSCWWQPPSSSSSPTFRGMWLNRSGLIRIACFVFAFAVLSVVVYAGKDSRWIGMASALPLPGLFALATLTVTQDKQDIASLGDTLLLGPLLVIPFNALLARTIVQLRVEQAGSLVEFATVMVFWVVAGGLVFYGLPRFADWRDRAGSKKPDVY